jgi:hypothetical protein
MGIWELLWECAGARAALQQRGTVWRYWSRLSFQLVRPTSRRTQGPFSALSAGDEMEESTTAAAMVECGRRIHARLLHLKTTLPQQSHRDSSCPG